MPLAIEDNSSFGDSTPELVEFETKTGEDFFQIHKEVHIKGVSISKLLFSLAVAAAGNRSLAPKQIFAHFLPPPQPRT